MRNPESSTVNGAAGEGPGIAIVGAGPGGLALAVLLAAKGARVTVYEAGTHVGGRTGRVELTGTGGERFRLDRGPTFFLMPFVLEEIFAAAGRRLTDYAHLTRLDPMYRLSVGGGEGGGAADVELECTQDARAMRARIEALCPTDGAAFDAFMRENRAKLAAFTPILRRAFTGPADAMKPDMLRALPRLHPLQSVADQLAQRFTHRVTRLAMSFQSKYLGMSPDECPSLFTILPFIEHEFGVWHPRGGCHALMLALARVAEELGVVIRTGTPVAGVRFDGQRATGVMLRSGESAPHEHVVLNADAAWALRNLVPESVRPASLRNARLAGKRYSCSTMMLYLGLRGRVNLPHHTIRISGRYEENLRDIAEGRLSEEPSLYVCNPSVTDSTLAPEGHSVLYVLVPTPNLKAGDPGWADAVARVRRQALERVSALAGEDIESRIVAEEMTTPRNWEAGGIQFGATFNLAHNLGQMLHLRPQHKVPGTEGLWLVGGGTHPGSGLPVIFLSSQITARALGAELGGLGIEREAQASRAG